MSQIALESQIPLESSETLPESQPVGGNPDPKAAAAKHGNKNTRISWSAEMTEALLETLKQQDDAGKRSDTGWKPEAWTKVQDAVKRASRNTENPSVPQLKVKVNNLKLLWREWVELGKASGFGWNEEREIYEAHDYVWDNYVKVILLYYIYISRNQCINGKIIVSQSCSMASKQRSL